MERLGVSKKKVITYESPRNGWDDNNEIVLKHIGDRRAAYCWLHNATAAYYEKWNLGLSIFNAVSTYILGTSGIPTVFVGTSENIMEQLRWVMLAIQILLLIVGTITTIHTALKLTKKVGKARWASGKNAAIFTEIKKELNKIRSDRQDYNTFYGNIIDLESRLHIDSPPIPSRITNKYYSKMGNKALPKEILFDENLSIDITKDANHTHTLETIEIITDRHTIEHKPIILNTAKSINTDTTIGTKPTIILPNEASTTNSPALATKKLNSRQIFELEKYFID